MQITKVEKQEKRDRYNIFADGKFLTALDAGVLAGSNLREGEIITQSELAGLLERDRFAKGLAKAYSLLARRPHATAELGRKLKERGYAPKLIEEVTDHLMELGYLDDASFAREWVRSRGAVRGPRLLRSELRQRGVKDEAIDTALADLDDPGEAVRELAEKRLARLRDEPWERSRAKVAAFLQRRGYGFDVIGPVLDEIKPSAGT
jgi:regulatory protein